MGVQTLINAVPEMSKIAHVEGEQVANIGSENMTSDIILQLSSETRLPHIVILATGRNDCWFGGQQYPNNRL
ncbi:hypothetical protein BCR59_27535 [Klebsiella pneumoniae]|nr:hypothetical protein BCR59_27535 [Klebsiella pneumoniae]